MSDLSNPYASTSHDPPHAKRSLISGIGRWLSALLLGSAGLMVIANGLLILFACARAAAEYPLSTFLQTMIDEWVQWVPINVLCLGLGGCWVAAALAVIRRRLRRGLLLLVTGLAFPLVVLAFGALSGLYGW